MDLLNRLLENFKDDGLTSQEGFYIGPQDYQLAATIAVAQQLSRCANALERIAGGSGL